MARGSLLQGVLTVGAIASQDSAYSDYIVGAGQLGAQLIGQRYGRDAERDSDTFGIQYMVEAGYDPQAAVGLQETFARLSQVRESGWIDGLFASHPPSEERVANNQTLVNELMPSLQGRDLEVGQVRYQQAIAGIKADQEAYQLFEEAGRAIADDDLEIAMSNLDEAISMVPNEARFSGLRVDIILYQQRYRESITTYNEAINKDDSYFDYYLGRGVAYARTGNPYQAQAYADGEGRVLARVINHSGIAIQKVQLEFTVLSGDQLGESSINIGNLGVNQSINVNSGLSFPDGEQGSPNQIRVRVTSARPQ